MRGYLKRHIVSISVGLFWSLAVSAQAGVVMFDSVTTAGTPVFLKVLTKGVLFPEGGRLVDVYLENHKIASILSGGDGYGYLKITPSEPGVKTLAARMAGQNDSALLLVMEKNEKAILFEIEAGLYKILFSQKFLMDTQNALKTLTKNFRLIYLTRLVGKTVANKLIARGTLPLSPVLKWQGAGVIEDLKSRHVAVEAVIGSAATISETDGAVPKRFTFEETEDETTVEDWNDILKQLQKE